MSKVSNTLQIEQLIKNIFLDKATFNPLEFDITFSSDKNDIIVYLNYGNKEEEFITYIKKNTSPKIIKSSILEIKDFREKGIKQKLKKKLKSSYSNPNYLLIVPYITDNIDEIASEYKISVIDLCGNYKIITNSIFAIRRDQPNLYKDSQPIKKIFSGNSSLVSRYLLREKRIYRSINEIYEGILNCRGKISLSTVSKVLSSLEEELMITKEKNKIKVIQPDKILNELEKNYEVADIEKEVKVKVSNFERSIFKFLKDSLESSKTFNNCWMISGDSSSNLYAVTTRPLVYKVYVQKIPQLEVEEDNRFFNVIFQKTSTSYALFDPNFKRSLNWSNEIQTYLELSQGDKRDKEIALPIKNNILEKFS